MDSSRYRAARLWLGRTRTIQTRDDRTLHLRAGHRTDLPALQGMHGRCSAESTFRRYFTAFPRVSRRWQEGLLATEICTVAIEPSSGRLVGMANAAPMADGAAEFAVLVEDRWHGRGVGSALAGHAAASARLLGYRRLAALALPGSDATIALARRIGPTAVEPVRAGTQVVLTTLRPSVLASLRDPDQQPRPTEVPVSASRRAAPR